MLIASHLDKIERLETVLGRMDPLADFELWFWSTMVSGTNAINAALHHAGVTPAEDAFPSQPGVYYVPSGDGYRPVLKSLGDILHVGRPSISSAVPEDIHYMMEAIERVEAFRDPCIRGEMEPNAEIIATCSAAYRECIQLLNKRLAR